jgi:polysaccharide biosynthesis/export protein
MNKKLNDNLKRLAVRRTMVFGGVFLAAVFAFSGCATTPKEKSPAPVKPEAPHSETIIFREGDSVKITFTSSPNLDTVQQIRRDGKISMALVGEIQAAGLTPGELQDSLIKAYASQLASKQITVDVQSSSFPVFVTGAVVRPGKVLTDHPMTALEAVMEAGGFDNATANMKAVKVIRMEDGMMKHYVLNLKQILDGGKDVKPFYLKPQDIIYVSERFELF